MCIGTGYWSWIGNRRGNSDREQANRPRSASYGSEADMVYDGINRGGSTRVVRVPLPPMAEKSKAKSPLEHHPTKLQDDGSLASPKWVDESGKRRPTILPVIKLPSPGFADSPQSAALRSPSQWSLFPKDDRPYSAPIIHRPDTAGSVRPRLPRMASASATTNLSLTNLAPTPVEVMPSPFYAASEYASIHRESKRISAQSVVSMSEMPPLPPPKTASPPLKRPTPPPKEASPLSTPKSILAPQIPPVMKQPRPMSFRTFIAQAQGRTPQHEQETFIRPPMPPTPPMSPDISTMVGDRKSRRTSFKSYIGRNNLGDEGIFVATSDDPAVPFTFFRWPNTSDEPSSPRSSKFWAK